MFEELSEDQKKTVILESLAEIADAEKSIIERRYSAAREKATAEREAREESERRACAEASVEGCEAEAKRAMEKAHKAGSGMAATPFVADAQRLQARAITIQEIQGLRDGLARVQKSGRNPAGEKRLKDEIARLQRQL